MSRYLINYITPGIQDGSAVHNVLDYYTHVHGYWFGARAHNSAVNFPNQQLLSMAKIIHVYTYITAEHLHSRNSKHCIACSCYIIGLPA